MISYADPSGVVEFVGPKIFREVSGRETVRLLKEVAGATDNISLGILRYFHERGIKVPEEISVAGFGGYEVGAVVYPALTTVAFDYELVGMKAARYMLDLLQNKPVEECMDVPLFFVERESVRNLTKACEPEQPASMNGMT